jgi:CubicO group peptidase (beta-lactamase class C family)
MTVLEPGTAEEVGFAPDRIELARTLLHDHVASGRAPSAVAIVARRGRIVLAEAAGVQRPDGTALSLDHVWPLASACKPFTAATLMSLVEEGRVGVMEPIVTHLPELAGSTHDDVLVHHLLTHTAGWESPMFTGRMASFVESGELTAPPEGRDLWSHIFLSLAFDPIRYCEAGSQMAYANVNYELISEIIRRITGTTLDQAMRERVLDPLGMTDTAMIVPDPMQDRLVRRDPALPFGSLDAPGGIDFQSEMFERADVGGAGVFASPHDLAVFAQTILNGGAYGPGRILSPSTVRSMVTNQIPGTNALFGPDRIVTEASWGYGFSVVCEERWPYFGGGLVPLGSATHPGAGGISYWIDFEHEIVGVFFEVLTEITEMLEPVSGMSHRFQDVITGAVVA